MNYPPVLRSLLCFVLLVSAVYSEFPRDVVLDTSVNYIRNTPKYTVEEGEIVHTMRRKLWDKKEYDLEWDFYMIFRVLHDGMIPLWQKVVEENSDNTILTLWYINALTRLNNPKHLPLIESMRDSENPVFREYIANAYGVLGSEKHLKLLEKWRKKELNGYVKETLRSSMELIRRGGRGDRIDYLPVLYKSEQPTVQFFYNVAVEFEGEFQWTDFFSDSLELINTSKVIYPHQMYAIPLKNMPSGTFGNIHGKICHVGEDSGWLLEGLPVHAVADGIVRVVQHEISWGNLVVIESMVNGVPITHLYGHLAEEIDVKAGDLVHAGEKIGTIGRSVSYENGGYWAHTHIGIERTSYRNALLAGYADDLGKYISMDELKNLHEKN